MMETAYKYNPKDYEDVLCRYMTAFYQAHEENNRAFMISEMEHLFSETKYAMKEGEISESTREEMLEYFGGLMDA